jgi:hypothetical protein
MKLKFTHVVWKEVGVGIQVIPRNLLQYFLNILNSSDYHMYLQVYGVNFSVSGDVSFLGLWYERVKLCFDVLVCMLSSTYTHARSCACGHDLVS